MVSPLLANVVLNKLDWFLHDQGLHGQARDRASRRERSNVCFTQYVDDWCVFVTRGSKHYAERLRERIREFLGRHYGLELSMEKTRITHVRDSFDFLGFQLELGIGQRGKLVPKVRVPRKALTRAVFRLNEAMRWRPLQESGAARIVRGFAVVRGWSNYYRIAHNFHRAANRLDHHAFWIGVKTLSRKFDLTTAQCLRKYGTGNCISMGVHSLLRAQETTRDWRQHAPEPYRPSTGCHLEDVDWEAEFRFYDRQRPGSMDFKALALFHDGFRCRQCGIRITYEHSQADHIKPVSGFASFRQAHMTTSRHCVWTVTRRKPARVG